MSQKALSEIAAHTAACNVRQQSIETRLGGIEGYLKWANKQGIVILFGIVGAILLEVARAKGWFG